MPEIANVLGRLDIPLLQVTEIMRGDAEFWREVEEWFCAAEVAHTLAYSRLGLMGHYYSGMLEMATDRTKVSGCFGIYLESLEGEELSSFRASVAKASIQVKLSPFRGFLGVGEDYSMEELIRVARTAVALDRFAEENDLDLLAYFNKRSGIAENEDTMSSIILGTSMLTGRGVPVAGEYETKNVIAMKIRDLLGVGGSFSEYYAVDFASDLVSMGYDGPGHIGIAQVKIKVRPLQVYHRKVGKGLSVEMSVKHGPITLLSMVEAKNRGFKLLVAEGECIAGEILEIGNTNSRYRFAPGERHFVEQWISHGPAHHCAIGLGRMAGQLEKVARSLNLGFIQVC